MKSICALVLIFILSFSAFAASNTSGPDSPVVVGVVKAVNGKIVEVQTKDYLRKLEITEKTKVFFVSFLNVKKEMKPGYGVKAKQSGGKLKSIHITLPINDSIKNGEEMLRLSSKELFSKADLDKSGEVSYVEFSSTIFRSDKHGPDHFVKIDKDKSGGFNFKEFETKMTGVVWWRLSRKSTEQWFKEADKNSNSKIELDEFNYIAQSGSHYKDHFKRADKDKSGQLNSEEVAVYIKGSMSKFK